MGREQALKVRPADRVLLQLKHIFAPYRKAVASNIRMTSHGVVKLVKVKNGNFSLLKGTGCFFSSSSCVLLAGIYV